MSRSPTDGRPRGDRILGWWLTGGGLVGLVVAAALTYERLQLLQDPDHIPSCSISPILSCGSVMESWQGAVLGFPNPLLGLVAFPVLVTTGVALLSGGQFARWFWVVLQLGVTAGMAFVLWLIAQSLYSLGVLCPYCMVVWAVVIPVFLRVTVRNLDEGVLFVRGHSPARATMNGQRWFAPLTLGSYLIVLLLVLLRFWSYWMGLS